jgi:hypothetical protein
MKNDIIGQLVAETISIASEQTESNVVSLSDYFDKKTTKVEVTCRRHPVENIDQELMSLNLAFCVGEFELQSQSIKLKHNKHQLDFPVNWSEFSMLKPDESFSFFALDKDIDRVDLLNLFSDVLEENLFSLLGVLKNNKFYLVGFKHDEYSLMSQVLEMLKGFKTFKKIA